MNGSRFLEGKTALGTGADRGIRRSCAPAFAQQGAGGTLANIDPQRGEQAAREIAAETGATTDHSDGLDVSS